MKANSSRSVLLALVCSVAAGWGVGVTGCGGRTVDLRGDGSVANNNQLDAFVSPTCGNGVLDPNEECDGHDLAGHACQTLGYDSGTLACTASCRFDMSRCVWDSVCGNGIREPGEECDCGTDLRQRPLDCAAINNAPNGFCVDDCTRYQCDAGEIVDPCDPVDPHSCCDDRWTNDVYCEASVFVDPICMLACTSTDDCYYNSFCYTQFGMCYPAYCGPGTSSMLGGQLDEPCQVPDGGAGYCYPLDIPEEELGICLENSPNALADGAVCVPPFAVEMRFPRDIGFETCLNGLCLDEDLDGVYYCLTLYP